MKIKFRLQKHRIHKSISIYTKDKEIIVKFNPFRIETIHIGEKKINQKATKNITNG